MWVFDDECNHKIFSYEPLYDGMCKINLEVKTSMRAGEIAVFEMKIFVERLGSVDSTERQNSAYIIWLQSKAFFRLCD